MKLIMRYGTSGFSEREKALVANIARYHRKANPDHKHKLWIALSEKDRTIVNKLSAILRIADGLDRSHQSPVRRISCKIQTSRVTFYIDYFGDINSELYGAEKKSELFKKIFSREAIFIPKRIQNPEY